MQKELLSLTIILLIIMGCGKYDDTIRILPYDGPDITVGYRWNRDSLYCYTKYVQIWRSKDTLTVSGYRKGKEAFHFQVLVDTLDFPFRHTLSNNAEKIKQGAHEGNIFFDPQGWSLNNPVSFLEDPYDEISFNLTMHDSILIGHFDGVLLGDDSPALFYGSFYGKVEYRK
jgi:hypothetical protein